MIWSIHIISGPSSATNAKATQTTLIIDWVIARKILQMVRVAQHCMFFFANIYLPSYSSTNKTDRHDITEILLKWALNTITLYPHVYVYPYRFLNQAYAYYFITYTGLCNIVNNKKTLYILCFTIIDGYLHELRVSYKMQKLLTLREDLSSPEFTWVHLSYLSSPRFLVEYVLLIFVVICVAFLILFVFVLYLVYPLLLVSLDCPFLISPSVFSNVYLKWQHCLLLRHIYMFPFIKLIFKCHCCGIIQTRHWWSD